MRRAENDARRAAGLPAIGAGWIAETQLYQRIREAFPDMAVVRHARPRWLAPQHLDIFLPDHDVGVEYQGLQHTESVDFFGGEKGFKQLQERDSRKTSLCKKNNCLLILVHPDYDPAEVIAQIKAAF